MKRTILILAICLAFLVNAPAQTSTQGQRVTQVELKSTGQNGSTLNTASQVTFIFRASYTGNVGGIAFTSADVPLTIRAENGSTLRAVPFTVTAGTLVVVQVH